MKTTDRVSLQDWDEFKKRVLATTSVDHNESEADKYKRIQKLEADPEAWFKYYFPSYCTAEPADFHRRATKRILNNERWYEVRAWSRELAKTARAMMEVLYLALVKDRKNILYVSNTYDNAVVLLAPIKINLEVNHRINNDYGQQCGLYGWDEGSFKTNGGISFRAIGAGQSPRGTRNEHQRPDIIVIDDIDTDEEARNQERINKKWKWIEEALIPTVSVAGNWLILFNGNIIAKESTIVKASRMADHFSVINIRDAKGKSTWPEKNSEEDIDRILSKISFVAGQKEYFNNPIEEGTIFKEMRWDKVPPLTAFRFLVCYGDPAPSNRENKANCYKAVWLMGMLNGKLYIIYGFLDQIRNSEFVEWFYLIDKYVDGRNTVYYLLENNSLQDPFYEQVFKPLFREKAATKGYSIPITADERKKPDKFARIEGGLEPLNREGNLILNIYEKTNPHMQRLEQQFKAFEPKLSAPVDGPDCIEGGKWIAEQKIKAQQPISVGRRPVNKKRY